MCHYVTSRYPIFPNLADTAVIPCQWYFWRPVCRPVRGLKPSYLFLHRVGPRLNEREDTFYPSLIRLVGWSRDEVIHWQLEKEWKLGAQSRCRALLHQRQLSVWDGNEPELVPSCPVGCGKKEGSPCFHSSANHQALVFLHARDVEMNKSKVPGLMELTLWLGKNHKVNE